MVWHMWNSFYIGYVLAFPTTYVYIDAQEIMQAGIVKNLIYTMSDLFEFYLRCYKFS